MEKLGYSDLNGGIIAPNDYKNLIEELKHAKETIRTMEDRYRKDEKTQRVQFEHMMKLEDKVKAF